jgi:DHA1 family inner membrane transport protein
MTQRNYALLALAIGAFAIGTTEFSPMGLLPQIADGIAVSIPRAGLLISIYALGVMLGAPLMTLWFGRYSQRKALMLLMLIFTLGNLLAALAADFWSLSIARLITSLNHGAFFGIGSVVATQLVPKNQQASAVATMFLGLTIANIGGVPLATWFGQNIGWRQSFALTAVLGVLTMFALWRALPKAPAKPAGDIKSELKVLTQPSVVLALLTTVLGASAMFSLYTFIAPSLRSYMHATPTTISLMLAIIGVGFSIGNHLGGKFADRSLNLTLISCLVLLIGIMLLMPLLAQTAIGAGIALLIWGAAAFALVPPLQMRVMTLAAAAPSLASSVNVGAFNLGNALGAAAGSLVLSLHFSYAAVAVAGALLAALGLLLLCWQIRHPALGTQPCREDGCC